MATILEQPTIMFGGYEQNGGLVIVDNFRWTATLIFDSQFQLWFLSRRVFVSDFMANTSCVVCIVKCIGIARITVA